MPEVQNKRKEFAADAIVERLRKLGSEKNRKGQAKFGINTEKGFGVSVYEIRKIAKEIGRDHKLALELWETGYHETEILAALIDDPEKVTERQAEKWVKRLNSWDTCDQLCSNLLNKTDFALKKAYEWSERKEEFVKRAGFVIMTALAVHDKTAPDSLFTDYFKVIERESTDDRNFVKKAVNWTLRSIGKRNKKLNKAASKTAEKLKNSDDKTARWIGSDAARELQSEKVLKRLD